MNEKEKQESSITDPRKRISLQFGPLEFAICVKFPPIAEEKSGGCNGGWQS